MPNILLKKTFKIKSNAAEKSFTFHGSIRDELIDFINSRLGIIRLASGANGVQFKMDSYGHFIAQMNHNYQKYHEEDAVVCILDAMEELGYEFKFEYDQVISSMTGSSVTKREVFVFNKKPLALAAQVITS